MRKQQRKSYKQAIYDKCRECIYDPVAGIGNWKQQVTTCTSYSCPLYPVRPVTRPIKRGLNEDS